MVSVVIGIKSLASILGQIVNQNERFVSKLAPSQEYSQLFNVSPLKKQNIQFSCHSPHAHHL